MTNHYHLLLETPEGNLPEIMRHINGAYTNYYNTKRKRAGHLFQGRYKAILIEADSYMMELSRYIHLNPVRVGMVTKPEDYQWSSYQDYIGARAASSWLSSEAIIRQIGSTRRYREFVEDLLGKEYESPLQGTFASSLLGSETFVQKISAIHLDGKDIDREVPAIRELSKSRKIELIMGNLIGAFNDTDLEQKAAIYLTHRYSGARIKELGAFFDKKESAISQASRRFAAKIETDVELGKVVVSLVEKLKLS